MERLTTPSRRKRLLVVPENDVANPITSPTTLKSMSEGLVGTPDTYSPSYSRTSSPARSIVSTASSYGRRYADGMIPRRLTISPAPSLKAHDYVRRKLVSINSIDDVVACLKASSNVVVLCGAGISTSLGIPDFRSQHDGFYSRLSSNTDVSEPEEFFGLNFFKHSNEQFWHNVKPLLPTSTFDLKSRSYVSVTGSATTAGIPRYSRTHAFVSLLSHSNRLLTIYTQNIDSLEHASGIPVTKIIQCHGSWSTAVCLSCGKRIAGKKYLPIVHQDGRPICSCARDLQHEHKSMQARSRSSRRRPESKKRKRPAYEGDSSHSSDNNARPSTPPGLFKPAITFFGEPIPTAYKARLDEDRPLTDLVLVIGTSLKVRPVKTMVTEFDADVPIVWINRDRFSAKEIDLPGVAVDVELLGECDVVVDEICRRAGWDQELKARLWCADMTANMDMPEAKRVENSIEKLTSDSKLVNEVFEVRVQQDIDADWRWRISKKAY